MPCLKPHGGDQPSLNRTRPFPARFPLIAMSDAKPPTNISPLDDQLQAEIEAALGDMSLEDMLDSTQQPRRGGGPPPATQAGGREMKTGTVITIHADLVYVEFGPKSQGICPLGQFEEAPQPGAQLEFIVDRYDKDEGLYVLSRKGSVTKAEWESLDVGQTVEARCTGMNKGGLEMEVANHKAFMPAGQADIRHIADLSIFLNEKFACEVIEIDRQRARIILSRRRVVEAQRARDREELLKKLAIGNTMPATITSVQPYGAFADIGGMDGLIHVSDMSHARLKHPSEVVKVGDVVQVQVTKLDTTVEPPKVGLSMKACLTDPYQSKLSELTPGATVNGKVTKIMPFGAFVELAPGVEGLIHISELSHERVQRVDQVVKADEIVSVRILTIDPGSRRISLSLKALKEKRGEATADRGESAELRRAKAKLAKKFGPLKGGIG
jgi:small subunit ribosomal protein S1